MSRAAPNTPEKHECFSLPCASSHSSQADVVPEHDMHAEHVAALETTLFRKHKPTLVLSLESGRLRILSKPSVSPNAREVTS